jgi:pimeloyl-ACP methyl ester carboxylesterase
MAQDGVEVAEYLRRELHKERIGIIGVSWGSILGIHMAKGRPDLFFAYVGAGQIVNMRRGYAVGYPGLLTAARAKPDEGAVRDLEAIGPPPWDSVARLGVYTRTAMSFEGGSAYLLRLLGSVLCSPAYTLADFRNWIAGVQANESRFFGANLTGPIMAVDLPSFGTDFAVPVLLFQGDDDFITPTPIVRSYFDRIRSPWKQFVIIDGAGHTAMNTRSGDFGRLLVRWVRPLAREDIPEAAHWSPA